MASGHISLASGRKSFSRVFFFLDYIHIKKSPNKTSEAMRELTGARHLRMFERHVPMHALHVPASRAHFGC